MNRLFPLLATATLAMLPQLPAGVILSTDFKDAEVRSYTNADTIGSGEAQMATRLEIPNVEILVAEADGAHVLEFINNGTEWGQAGAVKTIAPEIAAEKDLILKGSVVFTPLTVSGGRGIFQVAVNSGDWLTTSKTVTAVHITLESNLGLKYVSDAGSKPAAKLQADTRYRLEFSVDFSNPQQNTWEFAVYFDDDAAGKEPIFSSGPLNTRAPHITPGIFALGCGVGGGASTDPFVRIHRVSLTQASASTPR